MIPSRGACDASGGSPFCPSLLLPLATGFLLLIPALIIFAMVNMVLGRTQGVRTNWYTF